MGKTVTAALATLTPGKTANPHNTAHTPGGSSGGSAAAVASYMVPGAVGTQTNGSVIRPAAFCGTVGFKPSYGLISRRGVLRQSPFLDQVGVFARSVEDTALLAEVLVMENEVIAGLLSMILISGFLLGLAESIGKPPFWVIVVIVLICAWTAWYQDTVKKPEAEFPALACKVKAVLISNRRLRQ